ncbi:hypothetical protein OAO87_01540 [bacterium]|nr:hypothetical protein [bacterium]
MLFAFFASWTVLMVTQTILWGFFIRELPLEIYHLPRCILAQQRVFLPTLSRQLSVKYLEPAAKKRAAVLRARLGLHDCTSPTPPVPLAA